MPKVYLIESNQNGNITYKIGYTNRKAMFRKKELSTANAGKLRVVYEYETPYPRELETALHNNFSYCRLNGEWFSDELDCELFLKHCEIVERAVEAIKKGSIFL